jgi:hypothetical protein
MERGRGDAHRMSFARASSRVSTVSRLSTGIPKIARSTPAAARAFSPSCLAGAKKMETGAVFGSQLACRTRPRSSGILSAGSVCAIRNAPT